jgi:hypothetical protein
MCPTVAAFRATAAIRILGAGELVNWGYGSELLLVPCDCAQFGKNLRQDITPSVLPRLRAKPMPTGRAHL